MPLEQVDISIRYLRTQPKTSLLAIFPSQHLRLTTMTVLPACSPLSAKDIIAVVTVLAVGVYRSVPGY